MYRYINFLNIKETYTYILAYLSLQTTISFSGTTGRALRACGDNVYIIECIPFKTRKKCIDGFIENVFVGIVRRIISQIAITVNAMAWINK